MLNYYPPIRVLPLIILIFLLTLFENSVLAQGSLLDKYYAKPVFEQLNIDESKKKAEKPVNSGVYSINMDKGKELMDEGKYQEAIPYFLEARKIFQRNSGEGFQNRDKLLISKNTPYPEYYTALSYKYLEKYDSAILFYQKTIEEVPYFIEVYNEIGNLYIFLDKYEKAIKYFKKGHEINPKYNEITHNLGYAYALQGRYSKAREYLELAVAQDSSLLPTYKVLANIHAHFGRLSSAKKTLEECIEKNPDDIRAYYLKVNYYLDNYNFEKTREALKDIPEKFPDDYRSSIYLGVLDIVQDEYLSGINTLQKTFVKLKDSLDPTEPQNNEYYDLEYDDILTSLIDTDYTDEEKTLIGKVVKDKIQKRATRSTTEEIKEYYENNSSDKLARRLFLLYSVINEDNEDVWDLAWEVIEKDSLTPAFFLLAKYYYTKENFDTSIQIMNNYISLESNNAASYFYLGSSYRKKGEFEDALKSLNKAIEYSPYMTNAYFERGLTYQNLDSNDAALKDYYTYKQGNDQDPWSYYFTAWIHEERLHYDSARILYSKAIELNSNHYLAYYRRGRLEYEHYENSYKAFSDVNKSLAIYPDYVDALNYRAHLNKENDKTEEARKDYKRLIELAPTNSYVRKNQGEFYMKIEEWENAIKVFREAFEIDSLYSYVISRIADAKFELKERDSAISYYKQALEIEESYAYCQFRIAWVFSDLEEHDSAVVHYHKTLSIDSTYSNIYGNLGWEHYLLGNFHKCIDFSLIELEKDSESYYAKYNLALAHLRLGNNEKAKKIYNETVKEATESSTLGALGDLQELMVANIKTVEAREIIELYFLESKAKSESEE